MTPRILILSSAAVSGATATATAGGLPGLAVTALVLLFGHVITHEAGRRAEQDDTDRAR